MSSTPSRHQTGRGVCGKATGCDLPFRTAGPASVCSEEARPDGRWQMAGGRRQAAGKLLLPPFTLTLTHPYPSHLQPLNDATQQATRKIHSQTSSIIFRQMTMGPVGGTSRGWPTDRPTGRQTDRRTDRLTLGQQTASIIYYLPASSAPVSHRICASPLLVSCSSTGARCSGCNRAANCMRSVSVSSIHAACCLVKRQAHSLTLCPR